MTDLVAELAEIRKDVREWVCTKCRVAYPGPPQPGLKCVVCPACGGTTAPLATVERKEAEAERDRAEAELSTKCRQIDAQCQHIERLRAALERIASNTKLPSHAEMFALQDIAREALAGGGEIPEVRGPPYVSLNGGPAHPHPVGNYRCDVCGIEVRTAERAGGGDK